MAFLAGYKVGAGAFNNPLGALRGAGLSDYPASAIVLLLMISAIGLTALQSAQSEASGAGRSRRKVMTLYAADGAQALVEAQLDSPTSQYPNTASVQDPQFITDQWGGATAVRTGNSENPLPQTIQRLGQAACEGCSLNVNAANNLSYGIYRTGIVATDQTGAVVELQLQYAVSEGSNSYR